MAASDCGQKHALELGSGPGLAGMAAALLGWNTTLTDVADVLPLLKQNVQHNFSGRAWLDSVSVRDRFGGIQVLFCNSVAVNSSYNPGGIVLSGIQKMSTIPI